MQILKWHYRVVGALAAVLLPLSLYLHLFHPDFGGPYSSQQTNLLVAKGQKLYAKYKCASCHGPTGKRPNIETYPRINNQPVEYLSQQIYDISNEKRTNGMAGLMKNAVGPLSLDEARALAEFLHAND